MSTLFRIPGAPTIILDRNGAGLGTALLDGTFRGSTVSVAGLDKVKLRVRHDQADSTSISVRVSDGSTTAMVGATPAPILSTRHNANQGTAANAAQATGPNSGGFVGATGTVHLFIAADNKDDVLLLSLGGAVDKLTIEATKTGGTAISGNRVQIEITAVEG